MAYCKRGNHCSFRQLRLNWLHYKALLVCLSAAVESSAHLGYRAAGGFDCLGLWLGGGNTEECMRKLKRLSVNEVRNVGLLCDWTDAQSFDVW